MILIENALTAVAFVVIGVAIGKFLNTQSRDRETVDVAQRIGFVLFHKLKALLAHRPATVYTISEPVGRHIVYVVDNTTAFNVDDLPALALVTLIVSRASNGDIPRIELYLNSIRVGDFQIYPRDVEDVVKKSLEVVETHFKLQEK